MIEQGKGESRKSIRALVVSECPAMLEGVASILTSKRHIQVVSKALDPEGAIRAAVQYKPDVIITDWQLQGSHVAILVHVIRTELRQARIVVLSALKEDAEIVHALRSGAVGYIDRNSSPEELLACVEQVHAGHRHLADIAAMRLSCSVHSKAGLTAREKQLVELLSQEKTDREIAAALGISPSTVRSHLSGLFMKLNARNRAEAVEVAIECGVLAPVLETTASARRESASTH